ncbi:MAG: D-Ala-D-Ala carboxypeptidase family metallohydrolase [Tannerellaceae bacterium]|nr:D-Ala-D-Ala carboxypeptidase family metallohydrolase [Tannerellaceae bacterium]
MEIKSAKMSGESLGTPGMKRYTVTPIAGPDGFTWEEFLYSETAVRNGLYNIPTVQVKEAIRQLVVHLLQPLQQLYGKPVRITSGYRSPMVNLLVKGVPGSQHTKGEAADLCVPEGPEYLLSLLRSAGLVFDQAIVYRKRFFLHLSYRADGNNRQEVLYQ